MGKASRDKGMRGEREFAAAVEGQKIPLSGAAGGEFGNDVVMPNGMRAEVKRFKSGEKTLYNWIMDEREKPDLVGFRADRKPWIVAMKLTKFLPIMRANMAAAAMLKYTDADGAPMPGLRAEFAESIKALREALGVDEDGESS